jgi:threonylcarbamoyladenosine tRNA methylthiotransferase MtaB
MGDLVLGATENLLPTISMISKNDFGGTFLQNAEADFMWEAYSIATERALKVQDGCDYKCTHCTIPLARGISRVMS